MTAALAPQQVQGSDLGFSGLPSAHALGVMLLTIVALFLFTRERVPIETTGILVLAVLAVSFTVFPFETEGERLEPEAFFAGFSNDALIATCALMIASYGLGRPAHDHHVDCDHARSTGLLPVRTLGPWRT